MTTPILSEQDKLVINLLYWMGVEASEINALVSQAKVLTSENYPPDWQKKLVYHLHQKVSNKELNLIEIDSNSFSLLWKAITKLPYEERLCFLLCRILGWESHELSDLFGLSINECNQMLVRTMEKLSQ